MAKQKQNYYQVKYRGTVVGQVPVKGHYKRNSNHKYFKATNTFHKDYKSKVIFYFLDEHCSSIGNTKKQWKKDTQPYVCSGRGSNKWVSKYVNYKILDKFIKSKHKFNYGNFNMPEYNCDWLDTSIDMSINFHIPSGKVGMPIQDFSLNQRFGTKIGITPQLDREGFTFSTLQPLLLIEIVKLRNELIKNSDKALEPNWFFKLRELIINTISIVEITLMQFYIKAEYTYNPSWNFDKSQLGERFGRRLMDKVKWIKQITGNQPNITNELDALKELKQIRNHLSHFDPPSFCATLEEVERWLNQVIEIGGFLFEIRKAGNVKMSQELMTLMVQPIVKFNPEPVFMNRVPQIPSFSGYQTANWKKPLKINKPTKTKELNKQNKIKDGLIKLLKEIINKLEK